MRREVCLREGRSRFVLAGGLLKMDQGSGKKTKIDRIKIKRGPPKMGKEQLFFK